MFHLSKERMLKYISRRGSSALFGLAMCAIGCGSTSTTESDSSPIAESQSAIVLTGARQYQSLSNGYETNCAIGKNGTVWCWGRDDTGQFGDLGAIGQSATPVQVSP